MFKYALSFLLIFSSFATYSQTTIKRIDSLIVVARLINNVEASRRLLDTIQKESKSINYQNGLADCVLVGSVDLFNSGKYGEALKSTYDGEETVLSTKDNSKIAHLLALRGNCFNNLLFFEESKKCLTEAKNYADRIEKDELKHFSLARIYRIMAANFNRLAKVKNLDSALYYQKKSYQSLNKIKLNSQNQIGSIIQTAAIGQILFEMGKIDSSKYYYQTSLTQVKKLNLAKYAFEGLMGLGDIALKANQLNGALNNYTKAFQCSQLTKNPAHAKRAYQALANTYERIGETNKSLQNLKKYVKIADSIAFNDVLEARIPIKYIIQERESKMRQENELNKLWLIFTISIATLSLIIVYILYKNIKGSKKSNDALQLINLKMLGQNDYLHQTLNSLEESNEENTVMMQVITHDLRSPMAAIVGLAGFILQEPNLSAENKSMLSLIHTSGTDSLQFISEILEKNSKSTVLKKDAVDLFELLNYCTIQLRYKAKDKNQTLNFNGESLVISINRGKVWRVLNNLLANAIKFSPLGAHINISLSGQKDFALIAIEDNGIGIPNDLKDQIFNARMEGKREGTEGEKSFGLGLAICKEIIEAHHGEIWFQNNALRGCTFFVSLPK